MSVPPLIRINRAEHTPYIGRYAGGQQFLSLVTSARVAGEERLYAVLHTFDPDGRHLHTKAAAVGPASDPRSRRGADGQQQEWLRRLSTLLLAPIEVQPFAVDVDGVTFGLVAEAECVRLLPAGLIFGPPWDGTYRIGGSSSKP